MLIFVCLSLPLPIYQQIAGDRRTLELSVTLVNMIVDWRQYYTTSSIGWMSAKLGVMVYRDLHDRAHR